MIQHKIETCVMEFSFISANGSSCPKIRTQTAEMRARPRCKKTTAFSLTSPPSDRLKSLITRCARPLGSEWGLSPTSSDSESSRTAVVATAGPNSASPVRRVQVPPLRQLPGIPPHSRSGSPAARSLRQPVQLGPAKPGDSSPPTPGNLVF